MSDVIKRAVSFYGKHLPNKISDNLVVSIDTLNDILQILAPVKIIHSSRDVIQTFYMKFAKDLYKWDMAQYFTPTTVTDFLVKIINPQFGEHVADPACGSADFLVAAFRIARKYNPGYADCIWGIDNSSNAVQVAVLNMLLNGDGKTNIIKDDSLENVGKYLERYDVITCNPPFGSRIVETRSRVLRQYDLGYAWIKNDEDTSTKTDTLLEKQETGILFIELCVKICKPGGRIAIILPNGYLGNRSAKYRVVREWILMNAKVAAIVSLPRFTFKSSGADVSASVLYLEKRDTPLGSCKEDLSYRFAVELIEKVGWNAGDKRAETTYKRDDKDGSLIIDENGLPIVDCDFENVSARIAASDAASYFEWLQIGKNTSLSKPGWSVPISVVCSDCDLTLDPKRYSEKVMCLRSDLSNKKHIKLGDIVDFIPEKTTSTGKTIKTIKSDVYQYVEIQNIGYGDYYSEEMMGWQLPSRAKHFAESGDIFFGSIWGSASKWFITPKDAGNIVVTNGCFRCHLKENMDAYLPDFLAYLNTEGWAVQMRSLARGSDGLAEICESDASEIIIPCLSDENRQKLFPYIERLMEGAMTINSKIKQMRKNDEFDFTDPEKRPSHIVLV